MPPGPLFPSRLAWLAALLLAGAALAQQPHPEADTLQRLQNESFAAFDRRDFAAAEELLRKQIELDPGNFVHHYNLACALAAQKKVPEASASLLEAVKRGFVDYHQLTRDGYLSALRDDANVGALLENWPSLLDAHLESNIKLAHKLFGEDLAVTRDERLRVAFATSFDEQTFGPARHELAALYDWGLEHVFADLTDAAKAPYDAWVVVILPDQRAFRKWAIAEYGAAAMTGLSGIGGAYDHDAKRLIAQDLGGTLRHEFFHVLHWRSSTRLGQSHPVWIQEGLCSLVEDLSNENGELAPTPSWRTNSVKRLLAAGKLPTIEQLAKMPRERFTGVRPLANYAHARAVFLYLWDAGKLKDWYAAYTQSYRTDRSGTGAIEKVMGMSIDEIDEDFRRWLRSLPDVAEQIRPGMAGLGAEVDAGRGDGPVIAALERNSPARKAGLRPRDVILAIDGKPTRDLNELVRILGEYEPGETVEISYRRGARQGTAQVTLTAR